MPTWRVDGCPVGIVRNVICPVGTVSISWASLWNKESRQSFSRSAGLCDLQAIAKNMKLPVLFVRCNNNMVAVGSFFRGGVTYDTSGKLTVSRPGLYFVYAAVEGDPMNGHMRAGYSITLNGNLAIARSFYTRPYTIGTHDDSIMFVGTKVPGCWRLVECRNNTPFLLWS